MIQFLIACNDHTVAVVQACGDLNAIGVVGTEGYLPALGTRVLAHGPDRRSLRQQRDAVLRYNHSALPRTNYTECAHHTRQQARRRVTDGSLHGI